MGRSGKSNEGIMVWDDTLLFASKVVVECHGYPCRKCVECPTESRRVCNHEAGHFGGRGIEKRGDVD